MTPAEPIDPHFHRWWVVVLAAILVLALPLEYVWWPWWARGTEYAAPLVFVGFLGAELVAGGVRDGWDGTMTDWVRRKFSRPWRMALAFLFPAVVYYRFPDFWHLDVIVGTYLLVWLPPHYWPTQGPVDRFWKWVGDRVGVGK